MITVFKNCLRSGTYRKTSAWLKNKDIPFEVKEIRDMTYDELLHILSLTNYGTNELETKKGSTNSEYVKKWLLIHQLIENSEHISEVHKIIQKYPYHFKVPIIVDEKRLNIGFQIDQIGTFIPREKRRISLKMHKL